VGTEGWEYPVQALPRLGGAGGHTGEGAGAAWGQVWWEEAGGVDRVVSAVAVSAEMW